MSGRGAMLRPLIFVLYLNTKQQFIMYRLHYAKKDWINIPVFRFTTHAKMVDAIDAACINRKLECVWVLAKDSIDEVFVSSSYLMIQAFLQKMPCMQTQGDYYLQEYDSFEEAYKVALSMQEPNPLCYSNTNTQ